VSGGTDGSWHEQRVVAIAKTHPIGALIASAENTPREAFSHFPRRREVSLTAA